MMIQTTILIKNRFFLHKKLIYIVIAIDKDYKA